MPVRRARAPPSTRTRTRTTAATAPPDRARATTTPAELLESREILPGRWLQRYRAPTVAAGARAGQFAQLLVGDVGPPRRRSEPLDGADPVDGTVSILIRSTPRLGPGPERLRAGETVELLGPFGRPFEVDPRSRHLLLVAAGPGLGGLRMLVAEAIRDGRQVVLLHGAPSARAVFPSSLLPDEVEYLVATEDGSLGHHGSVVDLVPSVEAWADQAFAVGPWSVLEALARLAAGRRDRLGVAALGRKRGGRTDPPGSPAARRKAFLQVAIDQPIGCAAGICLGCVVPGAGGPQRACREGPVFAAEELAWEPAG